MKQQRWAAVPIHLIEKSTTGGRDEVFASAEVTSDRMNNIERSARDYARRWGWSPGKVLRFLNDDANFIDFRELDSDGTDKTTNDAGSEDGTEQGRNKRLAKVSKTVNEQPLNANETPEVNKHGASQYAIEQDCDSDGTVTGQLLNIERKKTIRCDFFGQFYAAYPKRKGKQKALKAFQSLNPSPELFQRILNELDWQKRQPEWLKNNGQFIPLPASWLNGRRWEDERPAAAEISKTYTTDTGASADYLRKAGLIA